MWFNLLRRMDWLNASRVRFYCFIYFTIQILIFINYSVQNKNLFVSVDQNFGNDFVSFYAAGDLGRQGLASMVYDGSFIKEIEAKILNAQSDLKILFFYPPSFIVICHLFAFFPYVYAVYLWWFFGLLGAFTVIKRQIKKIGTFSPIFSFSAILHCIFAGQNGLFMLSLVGGGLLHHRAHRPWLAGLFFGLSSFKPHLVWLIPIALLAGRQWRSFAAAALGAMILPAIALLCYGPSVFIAFLGVLDIPRQILEERLVSHTVIHSVFTAVTVIGGPLWLASGAMLMTMVYVATMVARIWYRTPGTPAAMAVLCAGMCCATPYIFAYDLVLLAWPIGWMAQEAVRTGHRPWERLVLVSLFCLPLVARMVSGFSLPLMAITTILFFRLCLMRAQTV